MEYIIDVTQADIEAANAARREYLEYANWPNPTTKPAYTGWQSCSHCPVAMALRRRFPLCDTFSAHPDGLTVEKEGYVQRPDGIALAYRWEARCSETMRRFMRRWDRTWQAKPHRFRVRTR